MHHHPNTNSKKCPPLPNHLLLARSTHHCCPRLLPPSTPTPTSHRRNQLRRLPFPRTPNYLCPHRRERETPHCCTQRKQVWTRQSDTSIARYGRFGQSGCSDCGYGAGGQEQGQEDVSCGGGD